jgi:hypothetical protein
MDNLYTLPEISFIGGEGQTILMSLWTPKPNSQPFNANSCKIDFSIINYSNKNGVPVVSKLCTLRDNDDNIPCIAVAELLPLDTVTLYGKYVYQVSFIDVDGNTEVPGQGIVYIQKNISVPFMQNNIT